MKQKTRNTIEIVFLVVFIPLYFLVGKLTNELNIYQILVICLLLILSILMYFLLKGKSRLSIEKRKKINLYFVGKNVLFALAILVLSLIVERIAPSGLFEWMASFASILGIQFIFVIIHSIGMLSK